MSSHVFPTLFSKFLFPRAKLVKIPDIKQAINAAVIKIRCSENVFRETTEREDLTEDFLS